MGCKANSAAYVSGNMPQLSEIAMGNLVDMHITRVRAKYSLDKGDVCGLFIITSIAPRFLGDRRAYKQQPPTLEGSGAFSRGHVESRCRKGPGPEVPGERLLRSARPARSFPRPGAEFRGRGRRPRGRPTRAGAAASPLLSPSKRANSAWSPSMRSLTAMTLLRAFDDKLNNTF